MDKKCILETNSRPIMLDELRSRFELQGMAIAQLPESLEHQLIEAGQILGDSLLDDNKIVVFGQGDGFFSACLFIEELTDSSNIERPALPSVLLQGRIASKDTQRQLQALGKQGDVLLCIQNSSTNMDTVVDNQITEICHLAQLQGMRSIVIGSSELADTSEDCIQIKLNHGSRMNYLSSICITSMTLAALIDHQLFGQPI